MKQLAITAAALALLLVACATGAPSATDDPGSPSPQETAAVSTAPTDGGAIGEMNQQMIDSVVQQAADETGVGADEINVVTAEAVTWSDGSIGCPEEGMGYTQALVPGFRVVLDVAGDEIHFHAGADGQFFACDDPREPVDDGSVDR